MKKIIPYIFILLFSCEAAAAGTDTIFNAMFRQEIGGWIAADATYSIYLPDGRTLWLFGDTFIGEVENDNSIKDGSHFIRNSAVVQDGDVLNTLFSGTRENPSAFLPTLHPDSTWYWPEHGVVESDSLYIFVAKFRHKDNGSEGFNFEHAGNDIAVITYPELVFVRSYPIPASAENGVLYGDRILSDINYTYIYGRKDDPDNSIPYPHVARAAIGEVHKVDWEYYDGVGWTADANETKRMNDFQVSQQYSVSTYRGKYILLTQDIWLSPKIYSFTSESPTGPWSNKRLVYTTPETGGSTFTYNAYVHPQYNREGGMLMSYNVNGDFWSIFNNVELYRPRFIRIPYMNLDYAFWPNRIETELASAAGDMKIYPNPVEQNATLVLTGKRNGQVRIELTSASGSLITDEISARVTMGENRIPLLTQRLPAGLYICRVIVEGEIYILPLVKK